MSELSDHPLSGSPRERLSNPASEHERVRSAALSILEEADEDSSFLCITSDYVIATMTRVPR